MLYRRRFITIIIIVLIFEALFLLHAWLDTYQFDRIDGISVITVWATVLTIIFLVFSIMGLMNIDSRIKELNETRDKLMNVAKKVEETERNFKESAEKEKQSLVKKAQEQIIEIINKSAERQNIFDQLTQIANIPDPNVQIKRYTEILKTKSEKDGVNISFVHTRRGEAFQMLERDDEAKADFEQAIIIAPKEVDPYLAMGCFYVYRKKDYLKSIEYFKKALELKVDMPQIYVNLGNSFAKLGNYSEAEKYYKLADDYSVESFEWYYNKANALREAGQDPTGEIQERYLTYCLKLNPHFFYAAINLSGVYKDHGKPEEAERVLTELITNASLKPEFLNAIIQRGECSRINGNYAGALIDFNFAYVHRPYEIFTILRLSQLNLRYGNMQQAFDLTRLGIKECNKQKDNQYLTDLQTQEQKIITLLQNLEQGIFTGRKTT